jgi:hypothetical protein
VIARFPQGFLIALRAAAENVGDAGEEVPKNIDAENRLAGDDAKAG